MKLLFCRRCQDVIRLMGNERKCECGETSGYYSSDINAIYSGKDAIPIGFANSSFFEAINNQPQIADGKKFTAFVIPKFCLTMERK